MQDIDEGPYTANFLYPHVIVEGPDGTYKKGLFTVADQAHRGRPCPFRKTLE